MKLSIRVHAAALAVLACMLPSTAFSANCTGTNINTVISWEPTEIGKGTTLSLLRATSSTVSDDRGAATNLVSGECVGSFLTTPDGKTQANGFCSRRDKDGDVLNEEWISTDGTGGKGNWKYVGGTGKFAGFRSSGQWEFTPLQGKASAVRWTGSCQ